MTRTTHAKVAGFDGARAEATCADSRLRPLSFFCMSLRLLPSSRGLWRFLSLLVSSRRTKRAATLPAPFPVDWRQLLENCYGHYRRLPADLRVRFEKQVQLFIADKRITGIGVEVTDELRVLVAASAVTLTLGWGDYDWAELREVLLYPESFDRDFTLGEGDHTGIAHPWGTVILSVPALRFSFTEPDDGYHVGIHEFAHLLDVEHNRFDGIPSWLTNDQIGEWERLRDEEMQRLRTGDSILDAYGAYDPVEFLAVAIETFFERPRALRESQGRLYQTLANYFRQDPATWDDERLDRM